MAQAAQSKVGCCGFPVSHQAYFRLFRVVEVQNTFYQLPRIQTAEKWRSAAPAGSEFTMKAWQLITHEPSSPTYHRLREKIAPEKSLNYGRFQPTDEVMEAWEHTSSFARALGARVVVFQCPASFRPTRENVANMRRFFKEVDRGSPRFAWEPRGAWPEELVLRLCEELDLIHCVDPFKNRPLFGDFHYFRLHGITGYAYRYTDDDLTRLKQCAGEKPSYLLFNNNWMEENALRLMQLMSGSA